MDEKLKKDIKAMVAEIFSEKEEAEMKDKTEAALSKSAQTIEELTTALEEKNESTEELTSKASELDATIEDLTSQLEAAKKEVEEVATKLAESEKAIEEMNKDRAAELRMSELEEAGVSGSDKEAQSAKIREMLDEDFASYKEELVSLREAIVAELSTSEEEKEEVAEEKEEEAKEEEKEEEEAKEEENEEEAKEEETEEEASEEESEETSPANIDPQNAISAALNMEIVPSDDVKAKYAKLGQAMADALKPAE